MIAFLSVVAEELLLLLAFLAVVYIGCRPEDEAK